MKVINSKDYLYVRDEGNFHVFESNPSKTGFDKEVLFVERARYIDNESGKSTFYGYITPLTSKV